MTENDGLRERPSVYVRDRPAAVRKPLKNPISRLRPRSLTRARAGIFEVTACKNIKTPCRVRQARRVNVLCTSRPVRRDFPRIGGRNVPGVAGTWSSSKTRYVSGRPRP